nr:uncharacterized protein LOC128689015 [Cherax quadricarinatus]
MKCVAALTFVFAALTATSGQASCPAEYLSFSVDAVTQVCVKFYMYVKGTWASMRALCQAEGADLAELRGDLHDQVYSYIFSHSDLRVRYVSWTEKNLPPLWHLGSHSGSMCSAPAALGAWSSS